MSHRDNIFVKKKLAKTNETPLGVEYPLFY